MANATYKYDIALGEFSIVDVKKLSNFWKTLKILSKIKRIPTYENEVMFGVKIKDQYLLATFVVSGLCLVQNTVSNSSQLDTKQRHPEANVLNQTQ